MITLVRSVNVRRMGDAEAAVKWALRTAAYLDEKYGAQTQVQRNVTGPLNQLHWVSMVDSLARLEEIDMALQADGDYQAMLADVREQKLFEEGSVVDHIYRTIG